MNPRGAFLRPSRFQFQRTREIRYFVYRQAQLSTRRVILDAGAGECLASSEMARRTGRPVLALDRVPPDAAPPTVRIVQGRLEALPFGGAVLDAVVFHFVLLWLKDPVHVLEEVRRALKPGGAVLVLAEPDLTRREDEPNTGLGNFLARSVEGAGGCPNAGRLLPEWFGRAGFRYSLRETQPEWVTIEDPEEVRAEVRFLLASGSLSPDEAAGLEERERVAFGVRRVRLPLTYGCAWKEQE
jgi:SAM-dependent methyltransferase